MDLIYINSPGTIITETSELLWRAAQRLLGLRMITTPENIYTHWSSLRWLLYPLWKPLR